MALETKREAEGVPAEPSCILPKRMPSPQKTEAIKVSKGGGQLNACPAPNTEPNTHSSLPEAMWGDSLCWEFSQFAQLSSSQPCGSQ